MKSRPILFTDQMVRAILAGRKTQTRRIFKSGRVFANEGDTLWVREAWKPWSWALDSEDEVLHGYHYRADATESQLSYWKKLGWDWKPSIFMPRDASRIELRVRSIRTELLRAISEEDAKREGFNTISEFRHTWTEIHGLKDPVSWSANPVVWVVTFSVL